MKTLPFLLLLLLVGCKKEAFKPTVTTSEAVQITANSAIVGGEVTSIGSSDLTDRGIYWGTSKNPLDNGEKLSIGIGAGIFLTTLDGLVDQTPYYYLAYATNMQETGFGEIVSFTTKAMGGTFMDSRDSHIYKWLDIGDQTWMAENLAYLPSVGSSPTGSNTIPYYYVYDYDGTNVDSAKAVSNYSTYGVLYNWPAALTACPSGWHLPFDIEWRGLTYYLTNNGYGYGGSGEDIAKAMAATSGWKSYSTAGAIGNNQESNNSSGFAALPGGGRYENGGFGNLGNYAYFWSASGISTLAALLRYMFYDGDGVNRTSFYRNEGLSVRCIKD